MDQDTQETNLVRMDASLNPKNNHGIMDEDEDLDSGSSSSDDSNNSIASSSSDFNEDSTSSTLSLWSSSSSSSSDQLASGPLYEMSSLIEQLPFKRGLSQHYKGKSQSFTSLSNVRSLEDLAKPENPYKKKLKSCKSYGGLMEETHKPCPPKPSTRTISKRSSKGFSYPFNAKRSSFMGNKPPIPPQRTSGLANQTSSDGSDLLVSFIR